MTKFHQLKQVYSQKDIFNCDEITLYYKSIPQKSFVLSNDSCKGLRFNKTRLTVLQTCNTFVKIKPM